MIRLIFFLGSLILIQCVCAQLIQIQPPKDSGKQKSNNNDRTIQPEENHIIDLKNDIEMKKEHLPLHIETEPEKANLTVHAKEHEAKESANQQEKPNDVQPQNNTDKSIATLPHFQNTSTQYGPLLRGFYVIVTLSALVLTYVIYRSYRLRRNKQSSVKVKKYGVVTRRNDIEMRRLELEEEDDDENLFDIEQHRTN